MYYFKTLMICLNCKRTDPRITVDGKLTFQKQIHNFSSKQNSSKTKHHCFAKTAMTVVSEERNYLRSRAVVAIRYVTGETLTASILPEWKVYRHSGSRVCSAKQKTRNSAMCWSCIYYQLYLWQAWIPCFKNQMFMRRSWMN